MYTASFVSIGLVVRQHKVHKRFVQRCLDDRQWCIECKTIDGAYKVYRVAYMFMNITLIFALETKCLLRFFFVSVYNNPVNLLSYLFTQTYMLFEF